MTVPFRPLGPRQPPPPRRDRFGRIVDPATAYDRFFGRREDDDELVPGRRSVNPFNLRGIKGQLPAVTTTAPAPTRAERMDGSVDVARAQAGIAPISFTTVQEALQRRTRDRYASDPSFRRKMDLAARADLVIGGAVSALDPQLTGEAVAETAQKVQNVTGKPLSPWTTLGYAGAGALAGNAAAVMTGAGLARAGLRRAAGTAVRTGAPAVTPAGIAAAASRARGAGLQGRLGNVAQKASRIVEAGQAPGAGLATRLGSELLPVVPINIAQGLADEDGAQLSSMLADQMGKKALAERLRGTGRLGAVVENQLLDVAGTGVIEALRSTIRAGRASAMAPALREMAESVPQSVSMATRGAIESLRGGPLDNVARAADATGRTVSESSRALRESARLRGTEAARASLGAAAGAGLELTNENNLDRDYLRGAALGALGGIASNRSLGLSLGNVGDAARNVSRETSGASAIAGASRLDAPLEAELPRARSGRVIDDPNVTPRPTAEVDAGRAPFRAYSVAERLVERYGSNRAPAETWRKRLRAMPTAERAWLGLDDPEAELEQLFRTAQADDRSVGKAELLDVLQRNGPQVRETALSSESGLSGKDRYAQALHARAVAEERYSAAERAVDELQDENRSVNFTLLPEGNPLRRQFELLEATRSAEWEGRSVAYLNQQEAYRAKERGGGPQYAAFRIAPGDDLRAQRNLPAALAEHNVTQPISKADASTYREVILTLDPEAKRSPFEMDGKHFEGVENQLVHARMEDFDLGGGKKGLYVHELQSDTAQKGRKAGWTREHPERLHDQRVFDAQRKARAAQDAVGEIELRIDRDRDALPGAKALEDVARTVATTRYSSASRYGAEPFEQVRASMRAAMLDAARMHLDDEAVAMIRAGGDATDVVLDAVSRGVVARGSSQVKAAVHHLQALELAEVAAARVVRAAQREGDLTGHALQKLVMAPGGPTSQDSFGDAYQALRKVVEPKYAKQIKPRIDEWHKLTDAMVKMERIGAPVPDNQPFKETSDWVRLGLKRVIDEAVAGGYDEVRFTTDALQRRMYGKSAPTAFYDTTVPQSLQRYARSQGVDIKLEKRKTDAPKGTALAESPGFRITPEVRQQLERLVREGQPLFAVAPVLGLSDTDDPGQAQAAIGALLAGVAPSSIGALVKSLKGTGIKAGTGQLASGLATLTQEAQSVGRYGLVRLAQGQTLSASAAEEVNVAVAAILNEPATVRDIDAIIEAVTGQPTSRTVSETMAEGVYNSERGPNRVMVTEDTDEQMRVRAAIHGLIEGQDATAWHRWLGRSVPKAERTPSAFGVVVTGTDGAALLPGEVDQLLELGSSVPALTGLTISQGHLLIRNTNGLSINAFRTQITDALHAAGFPADQHTGYFAGDYLDGPSAYVRAFGGNADALRAVGALLRRTQPAYETFAVRHGLDPAGVAQQVESRVAGLATLADLLAQPRPATNSGGSPIAAALGALTEQTRKEFGEVISESAPASEQTSRLLPRIITLTDRFIDELQLTPEQVKDWYKGGAEQLRRVATLLSPELESDDHWTVFNAVSSILSAGTTVEGEIRSAMNVWDAAMRGYRETGSWEGLSVLEQGKREYLTYNRPGTRLSKKTGKQVKYTTAQPFMAGDQQQGMAQAGGRESLALGQRGVNHERFMVDLRSALESHGIEQVAKQLREGFIHVRASSRRNKATGEVVRSPARDVPLPLKAMGPKVGQYMLDKLGLGDGGSPIDIWIARLYHAARGQTKLRTATATEIADKQKKLLKLQRRGEDLDDAQADELAELQEWMDAAQSGSVIDDTVTPVMRESMQEVLRQMASHYGGTPSSMQALTWYVIKRMFGKAGASEKPGAYATLGTAAADALATEGRTDVSGVQMGWKAPKENPTQRRPRMDDGWQPAGDRAEAFGAAGLPLPEQTVGRRGTADMGALGTVAGSGTGAVLGGAAGAAMAEPDERAQAAIVGALTGAVAGGATALYARHRWRRATLDDMAGAGGPEIDQSPIQTRRELASEWKQRQIATQGGAHNREAQQLAARYVTQAQVAGRVLAPVRAVDENFSKAIARWFDNARSTPDDPETQAAYRALAAETRAQAELLEQSGVRFEFITDDPYANSAEMLRDVAENKRLRVFDSGDDFNHPLLSRDDNNLFRAVHDYFGHAKEGYSFGPIGEENAFRAHSQMYSPLARRAMATETRGQNSWVNYGPFGEANRADPANTRYADQKVVLMPDEFAGDFWRRRTGAVDPSVLSGLAGSAVGGAVGAVAGAAADGAIGTDVDRAQGALAGLLAGAGGGGLTTARVASRLLAGRRAAGLVNGTPAVRRVMATISSGARRPRERSSMLGFAEKVYANLFDDAYAIRRFGRDFADEQPLEGLDAQTRVSRRYVSWTDRFVREHLSPVLESSRGREQDVMVRAKAQRALMFLDTNQAEKTDISEADLRQAIADTTDPETVAATDALQGFYRRMLDVRLREGLLTPDEHAALLASEDFYTPFVRDWNIEGLDAGQMFAGSSTWANRSKGVRRMDRDARARANTVDPFEQAVLDAGMLWQQVGKQRVAQRMFDIIEANGGEIPGVARIVPPATVPVVLPTGVTIQQRVPVPRNPTARAIPMIYNGERVEVEVLDEELLKAWHSFGPTASGPIRNVLRAVKEFKRAAITTLPDFAIRNLLRDNAQVAMQSALRPGRVLASGALGGAVGGATGVDPEELDWSRVAARALVGAGLGVGSSMLIPQLARTMRGVSDIMAASDSPVARVFGEAVGGDADIWRQFLTDGGASIGMYARNVTDATRALRALRGERLSVANPRRWWEALNTLGETLENAPRLATYKTGIQTGDSRITAAARAADVSLDFSLRGGDSMVRAAGETTAFFNARLQGWDKVGRMLRDPRTFAAGFATITAPSVALWTLNHENAERRESYYAHPAWIRNTFWLVPRGGDDFLYIPKPFELGIMFGSLPERMLDWYYTTQYRGDDQPGESAARAAKELSAQVFAADLPVPDAVSPVFEQALNKDLFRNRDIVSGEAYPTARQVESAQVNSGTSYAAKQVGQLLDYSPERLDHWVRAYGGSIGALALRASNYADPNKLEAPRLPIVGDLMRGFLNRKGGFSDDEEAVRVRFDAAQRAVNTLRKEEKIWGDAGEGKYSDAQREAAAARARIQYERNASVLGDEGTTYDGLKLANELLGDVRAEERAVWNNLDIPAAERKAARDVLRLWRVRIARAAVAGDFEKLAALKAMFAGEPVPEEPRPAGAVPG